MKLTIDKEFQALCPDLTAEEEATLSASLKADGCRDPVVLWKGHGKVILDGHNRYRLCTEFGIVFKTVEQEAATREDAMNFIIALQLGRRNLTEDQKKYLRGKRFIAEKKRHGGDRKSRAQSEPLKQKGQNDPFDSGKKRGAQSEPLPKPEKTSVRLGKEYGVSPATIKRDAQFAKAVDTITANCGDAGPSVKKKLLSGSSKAGREKVILAAELPAIDQRAIMGSPNEDEQAARERLKALGPHPAIVAKNDPQVRWGKNLHDLYMTLNSIRDCGGIKHLARKWSDDGRKYAAEELRRIAGELEKHATLLEETL